MAIMNQANRINNKKALDFSICSLAISSSFSNFKLNINYSNKH